MKVKKLPIGIQDFRTLRDGGYVYVDKTKWIYELVDSGKYYFLARPRRFGKSLLLSTLAALFRGERDLFTDLWIEPEWDWTKSNPVIHISFSSIGHKDLGLEEAIQDKLNELAAQFGVTYTKKVISLKFQELIQKLSTTHNKVVLLIDEYDKPLIDYLNKEDKPKARANQKILKKFYSIVKDNDIHIELLLITGVSKFSKVGIFSSLNNLYDLTIDRHFADALGYTRAELEYYFESYLTQIEQENNISRKGLLQQIRHWYNGYSWDGISYVYNPFSMLSYFRQRRFRNFWFTTGTPTFLISLMKERFDIDIEELEIGETSLESYDLDALETIPILFQTGYLTIKHIDEEFGIYTLGYPNREVKDSMLQYLIGAFSYQQKGYSTPIVNRLRKAVLAMDGRKMITIINGLFKSIPYQIFLAKREAYYHSLIYLLFQYLGQFIQAEFSTSDGRIDAVVHSPTHIIIFEFKLDESAEAALEQIEEKKYAAPYFSQNKKVMGMGINFNSERKAVDGWQLVELDEN